MEQAEFSRSGKRGGVVRRDPVENIHPVIRKHPVTGVEALYVNRQFTRKIVGLKREESRKSLFNILNSIFANRIPENILNFLYDHIDKGKSYSLVFLPSLLSLPRIAADLQARLKWQPGTVALWDNRITAHSAIVDYGDSGERRHGLRVTPQAER